MAVRGTRPKSPELKLVDGNPGGRPIHGAFEPQVPVPDIPAPRHLDKPKWIKGVRIAELWDELTGMCWWLSVSDVYKIGNWCALQAEFEKAPGKMSAARLNALRALGSELGLDPTSRARMGSMKGQRKAESAKAEEADPSKKYFAS